VAHILRCEDVDFLECPLEIRGSNTEDVINKAVEHGRKEHRLGDVSQEMVDDLATKVIEEPELY